MAEPMGFYTDTTVCIGCKACEVACKEWNQLPSTNGGVNTLSGDSYDNTRQLDGIHWRHVKFIEQFPESRQDGRWLLMSDVCKHCVQAGCIEVCPTGAIIRTEFDTVVIQSDVCNGCRACIAGCPFGVIDMNRVNAAPFNNLVPETTVLGLPFIFRSTEHMHHTVDGPIGDEVLRVTARKDHYGEVKEFICNDCRYEHKDMKHWVVEGPRHIERNSVIAQNHYERIDLPKLKRDVERQLKFQQGKRLNESNNTPS